MRQDTCEIGVDMLGRLWDDHGRRVRLRGRFGSRAGAGPRWRGVLTVAERRMAGGVAMGVVVASAGLGLGMVGSAGALPLGAVSLGAGLVVLGVGWALIRGVQFLWFGRWERATVQTRLWHGECGACGQPIEDLPRDGFGGVHCPECGAVWLVDRFVGDDLAAW